MITESEPTTANTPTVGDSEERSVRSGRIGWIVAGSLGAGLAAAIGLVVGPVAGAPENVITGSVLLAFAGAWMTLAVLSERRTDQPQRWARVPAAVMAVSGAMILMVAPTGNEFGWVWPPALVGLVIWMTARAHRDLHSRARRWVVYPVFAALLLAAVGGVYETSQESPGNAALPMPGRLIDIGGRRLHLNCTGSGSPTVVLEPGLGEPSSMMAAWIAPDVAATTRVCVYDRAGRAWSDDASAPQDGIQLATDLHDLLDRAGEKGPYVLAGHSAGGVYVQAFASKFPAEVAGMVLLDSMHPDQIARLASYPSFKAMFDRASALMAPLARLGVMRAVETSAAATLPSPQRDEERAFLSTPRHNRSIRDEFSELPTAMGQARSLTSLGSRPLIVVTAERDAEDGWMSLQNDLAALSTNSDHRVLATATHEMIPADEHTAAEASQAVTDVVIAVRTGASVNGQAG